MAHANSPVSAATLEKAIRQSMLEEANKKPTGSDPFSTCLTCSRSLDKERAKLGGSGRFCSPRCQSAYDKGFSANRGPAWMCSKVAQKEGTPQLPPGAVAAKLERERLRKGKANEEAWKAYKRKRRAAKAAQQAQGQAA